MSSPPLNDKLIQDIKSLGLPDKAAQIYAAVLELGGAHPSKISEVTKLNRSTTYKILTDLAIKGLVNESYRRNKLFYQAEKPDKLLKYTKRQIELSEDRFERAKKMLPELEGLFAVSPHKPKVRFFEGEQGIIDVYADHITVEKKYEMLGISNVGKLQDVLPKKFLKSYIKTKERLGVTTRGIIPNDPGGQTFTKDVYPHVNKKTIPDIRYVPHDTFPFTSELTIYGDNRLSLVNFSDEGMVGVIIEDKTTHEFMRMIFEMAWVGAKKIGKNLS
jgi:sugar-specific transcriptional regulator TrmB